MLTLRKIRVAPGDSAAVLATRIRFAREAAATLLVLVALLPIVGLG